MQYVDLMFAQGAIHEPFADPNMLSRRIVIDWVRKPLLPDCSPKAALANTLIASAELADGCATPLPDKAAA